MLRCEVEQEEDNSLSLGKRLSEEKAEETEKDREREVNEWFSRRQGCPVLLMTREKQKARLTYKWSV